MNRFLIFLLFISNSVIAQVDLTLGLKAYYPFTGNANDVSGNNNNPSFNNATLSADRFGTANSAYRFNGIDNYIRIPNSPSLNQANLISICAWVKVTGFYQGVCHGNSILAKGEDDNPAGNYLLRFDDNAFTNGQNCANPIPDITHQNFYGVGTTTGGITYTPYVETDRWFSLVYTYDGTTAKIYVDCQLKISKPINGITFTNSADLFLGKMDHPVFPYWFNGIMDEVRIYNRVLNVDEVKAYGDCSLVAAANIGGIINTYTPVISLSPCDNKITVEDASTFNVGDTALIIQMKGAVIDSTNTAAFGTITDYKNAGNYEINYVKSKTGNVIELKNILTRQYDLPNGKVQLIRVPYYQNATISSTLTCLPWDGNKGGILVLNVQDTVNLLANMDVSGRGFKGGNDPFTVQPTFDCYQNQYFYPPNPDLASEKGEGIAIVSSARSFGKGKLANGGGGGNSHNSGGGGGGNLGWGGFGGYNFEGDICNIIVPFDNRGLGAQVLPYSNVFNRIYLGGGGGAGHSNNPQGFQANGGNGGGIIIVIADKIRANGNKIISNGANAITCGNTGPSCHEGMGGGGGGGVSLLKINNFIDNITIEAKGGKGGDMTAAGFLKVGPGGGGGFGAIWLSASSLPSAVTISNQGGANGVCTAYGNDAWGATPGISGTWLLSLQIPFDNTLFRPNIDSVRIKDSLTSCSSFDFKGFGYTNTNPVANWQWYFGDGGTAATQNTNHTYSSTGTFTVKLVLTDINGCKDSITRNVNTSLLLMDAGPADTICNATSTTLQSTATGATSYSWAPAIYLSNPSILNPLATPPVTTTFYLTATNATGCSQIDSVKIDVRSANGFSITPPVNICKNKTIQLNASGGDIYSWAPAGSLSDAAIANPVASPASTTPYTVSITDSLCGFSANLSTTVAVLPLPVVRAAKSNDIDCSTPQSLLSATGATQYTWSPSGTLNNPNSPSPVATPTATIQYNVTGTDLSGCINYDSIIVKVSKTNDGGYLMPNAFTPNNDGKNDCFGIKYWGTILELQFSIYNRWGQRIFYTTNPSACWNGKINGVEQDPNVFVYMIKAKTTCQPEVFRKGTFVLIR